MFGQTTSIAAPTGGGGGQVTNGNIVVQVQTGDGQSGGQSLSPDCRIIEQGGYTGLLIDVAGVSLKPRNPVVPSGGSVQLSAGILLDDETQLTLDASEISWNVLSGPLTGVDAAGLVTANTVVTDGIAVVEGTYSGASDDVELFVYDNDPDDFGSYAGDGIDDDWQFWFFGSNNPDASPLSDPDDDGQDNRTEFLTLLNPTNKKSYFSMSVGPSSAESGQVDIVFGPIDVARDYAVEVSSDLNNWSLLPNPEMLIFDSNALRTVIDSNPPLTDRFYRVAISKP